jgi:hypothetical protein
MLDILVFDILMLFRYVGWCQQLDANQVPEGLQEFLSSKNYQD